VVTAVTPNSVAMAIELLADGRDGSAGDARHFDGVALRVRADGAPRLGNLRFHCHN
jgi:hypothetical protein